VIYADFEAFIVKNGERDDHEPSGFCGLTVSSFPEYSNAQAFVDSGEIVMRKFFEHLRSEKRKINEILTLNIAMRPLTESELLQKQEITHCGSCGKKFSVRPTLVCHHQHVTGEFIDFVCNPCNLQLKPRRRKIVTAERENEQTQFFIPVVCHNMKGYDSHHILSSLDVSFKKAKIKGIASILKIKFLKINLKIKGSSSASP